MRQKEMQGSQLEEKKTSNTIFLGIQINNNLSWDDHITHLKGKLSSLCYAFRILINISNIEVLIGYYFVCIHSVLLMV